MILTQVVEPKTKSVVAQIKIANLFGVVLLTILLLNCVKPSLCPVWSETEFFSHCLIFFIAVQAAGKFK